LSAVVADGMIGGRHRSNMELVAQGIANIASPLFGGIPATGAIARTATNVRNGGRTPIAGITHAVTLLLITLFFGRWAGLIPMATLAGILVVVAYSMSEWRTFLAEFRAPKSDVAVLLTTFLLTVLWDLTVAIEVGMVLAAFLFMRRMAEVTNISALTHEFQDPVDDFERDPNAARRARRLAVDPLRRAFPAGGRARAVGSLRRAGGGKHSRKHRRRVEPGAGAPGHSVAAGADVCDAHRRAGREGAGLAEVPVPGE